MKGTKPIVCVSVRDVSLPWTPQVGRRHQYFQKIALGDQ